jgi:hypothetical protein
MVERQGRHRQGGSVFGPRNSRREAHARGLARVRRFVPQCRPARTLSSSARSSFMMSRQADSYLRRVTRASGGVLGPGLSAGMACHAAAVARRTRGNSPCAVHLVLLGALRVCRGWKVVRRWGVGAGCVEASCRVWCGCVPQAQPPPRPEPPPGASLAPSPPLRVSQSW